MVPAAQPATEEARETSAPNLLEVQAASRAGNTTQKQNKQHTHNKSKQAKAQKQKTKEQQTTEKQNQQQAASKPR